ncbi:hypothetical protein DHD05_01600 [Arenibacter sp. N53]|nr:hypothetical protein [Arenibacter sp. N53]
MVVKPNKRALSDWSIYVFKYQVFTNYEGQWKLAFFNIGNLAIQLLNHIGKFFFLLNLENIRITYLCGEIKRYLYICS